LALGMIPERTDHVPALPMIDRAEEPTGERSAPDDASFIGTAGLERPDARRVPIERPAPHIVLLIALGLGRIGGRGDLLPAVARRAGQLDAEKAVIERGVAQPVAGIL